METSKGPTKYFDADCSEPLSTGNFGHVAVPPLTPINIKFTNITNPILKAIIAGASVTLEATGVNCIECTIENRGGVGTMEVFGEGGKIEFTRVTVASSPTKCEVVGGTVTTNKLKVASIATNEALTNPVSGTTLASFTIAAKESQTCAVAGPVSVTGDVDGTVAGSFLTVNVPSSSKTLTVGVTGASLTSKITVDIGTGGTFHALGIT